MFHLSINYKYLCKVYYNLVPIKNDVFLYWLLTFWDELGLLEGSECWWTKSTFSPNSLSKPLISTIARSLPHCCACLLFCVSSYFCSAYKIKSKVFFYKILRNFLLLKASPSWDLNFHTMCFLFYTLLTIMRLAYPCESRTWTGRVCSCLRSVGGFWNMCNDYSHTNLLRHLDKKL